VGLVGEEGMLGISLILGMEESPLRAMVQGQGTALRMETGSFRRELGIIPALKRQMLRYLYVQMSQFAQNAACVRYHAVDARLSRWLLMTSDRAHSAEFQVTHEFLAFMLGVRRVGVTNAASALRKSNLIDYKRGHVTILDRDGLLAASCGCYQLDKEVYSRIIQ
jgi:CRP-like cAMP-binding protein